MERPKHIILGSLLDKCCDLLIEGDYQMAVKLGWKALNLFSDDVNKITCLGVGYLWIGELNLAAEYLKKAKSLTTDKRKLSKIYNWLGNTLIRMGNPDSALYYYSRALVISKEIRDEEYQATLLNNIANVYYIKKEYDKALEYYTHSLNIVNKDKSKAVIYNNMAVIYLHKGDYDKAMEYHKKGIEMGKRTKNYNTVIMAYLNFSNLYRNTKNYELAEKYVKYGLKGAQIVEDRYMEANGYKYFGWLYKDKGEIKLAIYYLTRAYNIYKDIGAKTNAEIVKEELLNLGVNPDKL